jgi:hypothetical protein
VHGRHARFLILVLLAYPSQPRKASRRCLTGHAAHSPRQWLQWPQRDPPLRCTYPASRQLRVRPLRLGSHEVASQLLGRNPRSPRSAERIEEKLAFSRGSEHGAAEEAQGFLGGVVAVGLLCPGHRGEVPDGGDLGGGVSTVYEVVVEGVARTLALARPQQCFVGVGPRKLGQRRGWCSAQRSGRMVR